MSNNKDLEELLKFDPLDAAEKFGGNIGDGMLLHQQKHIALKHTLEKMGDVHFSSTLREYEYLMENMGAKIVLDIPFVGNDREEHLKVRWNGAILFVYESYGDRLNRGSYYFNWNGKEWHKYCESGSCTRESEDGNIFFCGHNDIREAPLYKISQLAQDGVFLSQWKECPHLWLVTYDDCNKSRELSNFKEQSEFFDKINTERSKLLPAEVRKAIALKE